MVMCSLCVCNMILTPAQPTRQAEGRPCDPVIRKDLREGGGSPPQNRCQSQRTVRSMAGFYAPKGGCRKGFFGVADGGAVCMAQARQGPDLHIQGGQAVGLSRARCGRQRFGPPPAAPQTDPYGIDRLMNGAGLWAAAAPGERRPGGRRCVPPRSVVPSPLFHEDRHGGFGRALLCPVAEGSHGGRPRGWGRGAPEFEGLPRREELAHTARPRPPETFLRVDLALRVGT